jgi:hypothetical protein
LAAAGAAVESGAEIIQLVGRVGQEVEPALVGGGTGGTMGNAAMLAPLSSDVTSGSGKGPQTFTGLAPALANLDRPSPFRGVLSWPPSQAYKSRASTPANSAPDAGSAANPRLGTGSVLGTNNVISSGDQSGVPPQPGEYQPSQDAARLKKLAEDLILISPNTPGHGDSSFDEQVGVMAQWFDSIAQGLGGVAKLLALLKVDGNTDLDDDTARMKAAQQLLGRMRVDRILAVFDWLGWAPMSELIDMVPPELLPDALQPNDNSSN